MLNGCNMKLSEIIAEDITDLVESLDSHFSYKEIKSTIDYKKFRIEKVKINVTVNFHYYKKLKIAELLFTSDDNKYALLDIYGAATVFAIFGSMLKIAKEISNVNIWYFAAKRDNDDVTNYSKRVQFYNRLSKRIAEDYNLVVTSRVIRGDTIYILASASVNNEAILAFMKEVQNET